MKTVYAHTIELTGSHYEAGYRLGKRAAAVPGLKARYTAGFPGFGPEEAVKAAALFSEWCPGMAEELDGFADALKTPAQNIIYYAMTWLHPGCSHMVLLPSMTENGHTLVARNYEFNDEMEDFCVIKTRIQGAYSHIGTSVLGIGRDDGFNEHGLSVTMSSCGFPVGASQYMRRPAMTGLQFWAVIRTLLDTCRDVEESLERLKDMPIAYNVNMILADRSGRAALYETLDGRKAVRTIDPDSEEQCLYATNHPLIKELADAEPRAMENSLVRHKTIGSFLKTGNRFNARQLGHFLHTPYPQGLTCPYYKDFFGTTKSMVIDPTEGSMELCWGGREENGWQHFTTDGPFAEHTKEILIQNQPAPPSIFTFRSIV